MSIAVGAGALLVAVIAAVAVAVERVARRESSESADAIVMLGARVLGNGTPSAALRARAQTAAALFLSGRAPLVLFTGGSNTGLPSEARLARDIAVEQGVPAEGCVLEEASHSTADNVAFSAPLLKARGVRRVLIVSDGYHLLRASAHFREAGFITVTAKANHPMAFDDHLYWTLREVVALLRRPWLLVA